jgi:hypothetical protein
LLSFTQKAQRQILVGRKELNVNDIPDDSAIDGHQAIARLHSNLAANAVWENRNYLPTG